MLSKWFIRTIMISLGHEETDIRSFKRVLTCIHQKPNFITVIAISRFGDGTHYYLATTVTGEDGWAKSLNTLRPPSHAILGS